MRHLIAFVSGVLWFGVLAGAAQAQMATADMRDPTGASVGTVGLSQSPRGVLVVADLSDLPPGAHAFHVHAVGECTPPFTSAGGHFNPAGKKHGIMSAGGMHVGDMPNIHVGADGKLKIEVLNAQVTGLDMLFDADGSAIVIHAGADDYKSDPAGNAGPRIACGVVAR